ncbi:MAG: amidase [bacterium]|nr:amidase [bacterium]
MVGVKDLIDVRGAVTTGGGVILAEVPAETDAPVIERLRGHGCTVVGKLNLHEWALGVTSANPHYGAVLNPHDPSRIAGGSSGGCAAAVSLGICDWTIGTDTGGSIRIPAALCGVVGIRPSLGVVSTERVIPLAPSQDTVGPIACDVRTAARALELMSALDLRIPASAPGLREFKLAVPAGWVGGLDLPTREAWSQIARELPRIPFPSRERMAASAITIALYEAAQYHRAWLHDDPTRYGSDVRSQLQRGMSIVDEEYAAALRDRELFTEETEIALGGWDAILLPTTACIAPLVGQSDVHDSLVRFTRPLSLTGQPAISLPAPHSTPLPVGIQVAGKRGDDAGLAAVALALEAAWSGHRPASIE